MTTNAEPRSVIETRLAHDTHRRATALLADAAVRPNAEPAALAELRDFLVATLRHHHESEDNDLWPLIEAAAPDISAHLAGLSAEHEELERALDALAGAPIPATGDRAALAMAAGTVRDVVGGHLAHEEPLLFPALRAYVSEEAWEIFAQRVIETSPPTGAHLMVGFFDEIGAPDEVEMVFSALPEPVRQILPALRAAAAQTLATLRGA